MSDLHGQFAVGCEIQLPPFSPPSDRRRRWQLLPLLVSTALRGTSLLSATLRRLLSATRHPVPLDHYSLQPEPAVVQLCRFSGAHSRLGWQRSVCASILEKKRQSAQKCFAFSLCDPEEEDGLKTPLDKTPLGAAQTPRKH